VRDACLPQWRRVLALAHKGTTLFPGVRTQSWDVAITADGPVLLEVNWGGDLNLHQLAHGRGILTETFIAHVRQCGYKGPLPLAGRSQ
jgi:hypothetical protein